MKNNPALKGLTIPKTGSPSQAGLLVTKTLLFAGEGSGGLAFFHAYDKATGAEIWQTPIPGPQTSLPMTYMHQGRQYRRRWCARHARVTGAQLMAFALPRARAGGRRGGRGGAPAGGRGAARRTRRVVSGSARSCDARCRKSECRGDTRRRGVFSFACCSLSLHPGDSSTRDRVSTSRTADVRSEDAARTAMAPTATRSPASISGRGQFRARRPTRNSSRIIRNGIPGTADAGRRTCPRSRRRASSRICDRWLPPAERSAAGDAARGKAIFEGKGGVRDMPPGQRRRVARSGPT